MKRNNHVQSAYITTFRAYALNVVARIPMPDDLRKSIKKAIYDVELPLYEVVKCSKQQAWTKYCNRLTGAIRTVAGDSREELKIIKTLELKLTEETK